MARKMKKQCLGSRAQSAQFKPFLHLWSMTENIILSYPEEIFAVFISRLKPETQTMDGICSLPHDYGIQMKFNNPDAEGEKQWNQCNYSNSLKSLTDPTIVQRPAYLCTQNYTTSLLDKWGGKYISDYKQFWQLRFFPFLSGMTGRRKLICALYYHPYFHLLLS